VPPSCQLISRVVHVLMMRAGPAAQALSRSCLVPALALWCRARAAVLFRAVPVLTHRAWPVWPSIPLANSTRSHVLPLLLPTQGQPELRKSLAWPARGPRDHRRRAAGKCRWSWGHRPKAPGPCCGSVPGRRLCSRRGRAW
jgi:hypothetical protein